MKVGELKKLLKDIPNNFEIATSADVTGGVVGHFFAQRISAGHVRQYEDGSRRKTSNMFVLLAAQDREESEDDEE